MLKHKFFLAAVLALLSVGAANAATIDQMKTTHSFDYSSFTYSWTDSLGVNHISKLTDKPTDPYQIMALLAEVYVNPAIPGPQYSYEYNNKTNWAINYDLHGFDCAWLSSY